MYLEGIQTEQLCKIRSDSGDKATSGSGVDEDTILNRVYQNYYKIRLDEDLLTGNGCFYPKAFTDNLIFDISSLQGQTSSEVLIQTSCFTSSRTLSLSLNISSAKSLLARLSLFTHQGELSLSHKSVIGMAVSLTKPQQLTSQSSFLTSL